MIWCFVDIFLFYLLNCIIIFYFLVLILSFNLIRMSVYLYCKNVKYVGRFVYIDINNFLKGVFLVLKICFIIEVGVCLRII